MSDVKKIRPNDFLNSDEKTRAKQNKKKQNVKTPSKKSLNVNPVDFEDEIDDLVGVGIEESKQHRTLEEQNNLNKQKINKQLVVHDKKDTLGLNPFLPVKERDINAQLLIEAFQYQKKKWGMHSDMINMSDKNTNELTSSIQLMSNFVNDASNIDIDDVRNKYKEYQKDLVKILAAAHQMDSTKLTPKLASELEIGISKLMKICEQSYESVMCLLRIQEYANPNSANPNYRSILKPEIDLSKMNAKQKLILKLYQSLSKERLRKLDGQCWEEIKTPEGYMTQAYKAVCTVKSYILNKCDRILEPDNWTILTSKSCKNTIEDIEHTLTAVPDIDFPDVTLDRYKFSFNNGIFVSKEYSHTEYNKHGDACKKYKCTFYPYDDDSGVKPDPTTSSAKFFNKEFIEYDDDIDWYDIPTPHLQKIFDYQFQNRKDIKEICRIIYALIGRTLYAHGDLENWEVITFIQGLGGTGKSTISKYVLKEFYNPQQIAELDNKLEPQFGLGSLAKMNPYITIGDELDEKCQLDLTQFLKMVSGETITAAVKHSTPIYLAWPCHLWFSGNQLPPWEDKGGALSRRIITILFEKMVQPKDKDMKLGEKIQEEIPNIIQKCVKAYLQLVNEHAGHEFWKFCPKYFQETRKQLQEVSNIVQQFMVSDEIIFDKSGLLLEKEFLERMDKFATAKGIRISNQTTKNTKFTINSVVQLINSTYDEADIVYEKRNNVIVDNKRYNNVMVLSGIRLKQAEDANKEFFKDTDSPKKLFAFENDFEIKTQLTKLHDDNNQEEIDIDQINLDVIKNDKNNNKELIDLKSENQQYQCHLDIEYPGKEQESAYVLPDITDTEVSESNYSFVNSDGEECDDIDIDADVNFEEYDNTDDTDDDTEDESEI